MKIRRFFALTISLLPLLTACTTPVYNYRPLIIDVSEPEINKVATAYVGDVLVRQGKYLEQDVIVLHEDAAVGLMSPYTLRQGTYAKKGEDNGSSFYLPSAKDGGRIEKSVFADPAKSIQADNKSQKLCVITVFNVAACTTEAPFERTKQSIESHDSFQQSLIYSGRVGNRIRIGYREFSGNAARPAFNNEAEYDLENSKIISYKSARLEILEATNESIKYRVLRNFNNVGSSQN